MNLVHLAIVKPRIMGMLLSGAKRVESRMSMNRTPAWRVSEGDLVYFKASGVPLVQCRARVERVHKYEELTPERVEHLMQLWGAAISGGVTNREYWVAKHRARFAVFIELRDVRELHLPSSLLPRALPYASAWMLLPDQVVNELRYAERELSPQVIEPPNK